MNNENNNNKEQNIKDKIIKEYLEAENKDRVIKELSIENDLSIRTIYRILKENNISTPSKFKNDIDSNNIKKPKTVLQSFDDLETESISESLIKKYKDHGFYERDDAERNMNIQMYAEEITGLDVWNNYFYYLRQLIYDTEKTQLQTDIAEIKKGQGKIKTVDTILDEIAISNAEEIRDILKPKVVEPSKPEPEPEKQDFDKLCGEMIQFISPKMYLIYKGMTDPQVRAEFVNILNQYQQYNKLFKSKNPNLENINLKQKIKFNDIFPNKQEMENIKPKEKEVENIELKEKAKELNLTPQELKDFILSSMPEPQKKKKVD